MLTFAMMAAIRHQANQSTPKKQPRAETARAHQAAAQKAHIKRKSQL
jgi:hypothetical protein